MLITACLSFLQRTSGPQRVRVGWSEASRAMCESTVVSVETGFCPKENLPRIHLFIRDLHTVLCLVLDKFPEFESLMFPKFQGEMLRTASAVASCLKEAGLSSRNDLAVRCQITKHALQWQGGQHICGLLYFLYLFIQLLYHPIA